MYTRSPHEPHTWLETSLSAAKQATSHMHTWPSQSPVKAALSVACAAETLLVWPVRMAAASKEALLKKNKK